MKAGERGRMDAAHELGHLLLHRDGRVCGQEAEAEANAFASAFLLPKDTISRELPRTPDLHRLLALKPRWGVSVAALVRRGFGLGIYSEWQYKSAFIELSRRGWRSGEPEGVAREESLAFTKILGMMVQKGQGVRQLAESIFVPEGDIRELIPVQTEVPVARGPAPEDRGGHLRVVR